MIEHKGKPGGAAVELFELVAKEMDIKEIAYSGYPFKRLLSKVEQGQVDAALFIARSEERDQMFVYPSVSFDSVPLALAVRNRANLTEVRSKSDLYGLKIGYLEKAFLPDILKDDQIEFEYLQGTDWVRQNLEKLVANRIDAALSGYYRLLYETNSEKYRGSFKVIVIPETNVPIYVVFSRSTPKSVTDDYERALLRVLSGTTYAQVFKRYQSNNRMQNQLKEQVV